MADRHLELDALRDLMEQADVIRDLAKEEQAFTAVYDAFRAEDPKAYAAALERVRLTPFCRLVCEWIRIKECVFRCVTLCGPPAAIERPDPRQLAEAIVRITADDRALKQLVTAIEKADRGAWQELIRAHKIDALCHLFCHWVCAVRYRLLCRWLCGPIRSPRPDLAAELRAAGRALRALLAKREAFDGAVAAATAGDAAKLGGILRGADLFQLCYLICEFFCSWRCVLACLTLCRQFPITGFENPIREAYEFAGVVGRLAESPGELHRLSAAIGAGDGRTFAALVEQLKLQRFCLQLCHWICTLRCRRFCTLVCPPIFNHPWFTHVGDFGIYADIDAGTGLTNKAQASHGGPDYGFFSCLSLRGFCPKTDPANPGAAMAYRFLFQPAGAGTPTPITGGFVCEVLVGSRYTFWNGNPFTLQSVRIRGTGTTSPTPPPPSADPTPPDHFIVPDAQGWITVDPNAIDDGFNGWLMGFASAVGLPGGAPAPGVDAGTAVPGANQKNGTDAAIIFQATRVSTIAAVNTGGTPDYTNALAKIRINNWDEVSLLDIQEFLTPGANACSPLTSDLHILYTTDHELMAAWSIDITTAAAIPPPAPVYPSGTGPRGGAGSDFHDISAWPTCSYTVHLRTRRSLTTGLIDDSTRDNTKTFCIGTRRTPVPLGQRP